MGAFGRRTGKGVAGPDDPKERRKTGRKTAYRNARIVIGAEEMTCIAQDVSARGCRIAMEGAENLPDLVGLVLSAGAAPIRCAVIWRERGAAGIEFLNG